MGEDCPPHLSGRPQQGIRSAQRLVGALVLPVQLSRAPYQRGLLSLLSLRSSASSASISATAWLARRAM